MASLPLLLKPAAKDYIWGGSRLNDDFGKNINMSPLAETWECSTHPDGTSVVSGGAYDGVLLSEVLKYHPEYLGIHPLLITAGKPELPILIKFIDAKSDLSVQVHPDDEYALKNENSLGKTEMWYVLDARPGSKLVYGFNQDLNEEIVRQSIEEGTIEKFLNHVSVHKNDLFFIEAGTVHAIGAGALIAEIQENSNLTYRIYDYNRKDKNGKERELHIDKALKVANLKSSAIPRQPMRVLRYRNGCASELLTRCKYFQVERLLLNTEIHRNLTDFQTKQNSFQVLLCTEGCGIILGENVALHFFKGDCIFIPADSIPLKLHGKAEFLNISC
ncbi:MAG: class I mannose-6-phosphate isomerase [Eubacterium sp.]|nr:class I mannose-6-phosphate isomerase [Eubacterium sp.]